MAKVVLSRVDDRLVYGQIVNSWMNFSPAKRVIIIEDEVVKKPFLQDAFRMVMPTSVELESMTCSAAGASWKENRFGHLGPVIVLFRSISSAAESFREGFEFDRLEVGDTGKKDVCKLFGSVIALDESDIKDIEFLHKSGVKIAVHHTVDSGESMWSEVRNDWVELDGRGAAPQSFTKPAKNEG